MMQNDAPRQTLLAPGDAVADIRFDVTVNQNGYRWWYVDAFSDDGRCGMTVIIFIGCVFSPYYAKARRSGPANPWDFCSINAIFYGPDRKRWALTERNAAAVELSASHYKVGPSVVTRTPQGFQILLDEICVPVPSRIRGMVEVVFSQPTRQCFALDDSGHHRWWPIAPSAQVHVDLRKPELQWSGKGYVDSNAGTVPLETTFKGWHWTRTELQSGKGHIFYNREFLDGTKQGFTITHDAANNIEIAEGRCDAKPLAPTPIWRCKRPIVEASPSPRVVKTFEDTPFYARSKVLIGCDEQLVPAMHEYVDLARFQRPWVQTLLPFRMPRRGG